MVFTQGYDPQGRMISLAGVIVFHIILVWALLSSLGSSLIELIPRPSDVNLIDEIDRKLEPPPLPTVLLKQLQPVVIPNMDHILLPHEPIGESITATMDEVLPPPVRADTRTETAAVVRRAPIVKSAACDTPVYPAVSERLGETGAVLLELLVGVDGKVAQSRIVESSGYSRLDLAAQVALSRCRFVPGTVNGSPEPGWARLKYSFRR